MEPTAWLPRTASSHSIYDSDDDGSDASPLGLRIQLSGKQSWVPPSVPRMPDDNCVVRPWQISPAPGKLSPHWIWQKPRLRWDWQHVEEEHTHAGQVTTEEVCHKYPLEFAFVRRAVRVVIAERRPDMERSEELGAKNEDSLR